MNEINNITPKNHNRFLPIYKEKVRFTFSMIYNKNRLETVLNRLDGTVYREMPLAIAGVMV